MRPSNLWHLYAVRLRARGAAEALAVLGIAAGVALLSASQVAESSLQGSSVTTSRGLLGHATLQLNARGAGGVNGSILSRVRKLPGVQVAAPLLEVPAEASGPDGHTSVEVVGADTSLAGLGGSLARGGSVAPFAGVEAVALPHDLAVELGVVKFGQEAVLSIAGRRVSVPLYEQLTNRQIGPLVSSPLVIAPLEFVQAASGLQGRVTRVVVETLPGRQKPVREVLKGLVGRQMNVEPVDYDQRLFANAAAATNQSTSLFAVISALVGFLFAFNTVLLTVPQRRRLIDELRREGYSSASVASVLLLDAAILGAVATAIGLLLGLELATHLFGGVPGYLSSGFAVGPQRIVSARAFAAAVAGGFLAALGAVVGPLGSELAGTRLSGSARPVRIARLAEVDWLRAATVAAIVSIGGASAILAFAPGAAIVGVGLLLVSVLALLPSMLAATLAVTRTVARTRAGATAHIAVMELRTARARAIAVAAIGAVAVFGSVAIQGAHQDLLSGLERAARETNGPADIWVAPAGRYDLLFTAPFEQHGLARLRALPGIRSVQVYRGGLLDVGDRRVWVIAPSAAAQPLLAASQIVEGDARSAEARVRAGGWVVVSRALAHERNLKVGGELTLPAPDPRRFRIAALSTNVGWAPGAITMNADDFARAWRSEQASALAVRLAPGTSVDAASTSIRRVLGASTGLQVQSASSHAGIERSLSRQGLDRLTQIAELIELAAVLAMSAALGAMLWQRRSRLAKLKLEGFSRRALWQTVLLESTLLLGLGCATGAAVGLYGQQLLDRALANAADYPVVPSFSSSTAVTSVLVVLAAALAVLGIPGYLATDVAPALALED